MNVRPPEGLDAYDCFPKECEKAFQDQGKEFRDAIESRLVLGKQATRAGIMEGFAWQRTRATPGDLAVVYLTCHGGIDAGKGWGVETFDNGTLWGNEIKAELAKMPCPVLVFIETCASGGFVRSSPKDRPVPGNVSVLCACSGRQVTSNELDIASLEALYGRADFDGDGFVTLGELVRYVPGRYKEWNTAAKANDRNAPVIVRSKSMPDSLVLTRVSTTLSAIVHEGELWSALLEKRECERFKVHLIGWNNTPGEPYFLTDQVSRDCISLPHEGALLSVKQDGVWYPARLLSRTGEKYKIHYLGFAEDEVVTEDRIRYPFAGNRR